MKENENGGQRTESLMNQQNVLVTCHKNTWIANGNSRAYLYL
jgi:hypothetical protein